MWFSLENTGFYEPWKNERCLAVASGDDSVVWMPASRVENFKEVLKNDFAQDKKTPLVGLGQCIADHKIMVSESWNFDFCSK